MASFLTGVFVLLAGICVGIPAFHSIIYQVFIVFPKLRKFKLFSKPEAHRLLVPIFQGPVLWGLLIVASAVIVYIALSKFAFVYFAGLLIGLVGVLIELQDESDKSAEELLPELLKKEMLGTESKEDAKYSRFSPFQMRMASFKPMNTSINPFKDLPWECSVCDAKNNLTNEQVELRGSRMRFVVKCDECGDYSIVRISGIVNCRARTEGQLPEYDRRALYGGADRLSRKGKKAKVPSAGRPGGAQDSTLGSQDPLRPPGENQPESSEKT